MNYIYDITLNFNKELYNFYEWDEEDNVEYYLKVPIFKVEKDVIKDFIMDKIIVDKNFLFKIFNKNDKYKKTNKNKYVAVFTTIDKAVAISFNEKGESVYKSYLSIEEENDLLEYSKLLKYTLIDYKIKEKKKNSNIYLTRHEKNLKIDLLKKIEKLYKNKDIYKLKYIFYEIYNERPINDEKIYYKLINLIKNNSDKLLKIEYIFKNMNVEIKTI